MTVLNKKDISRGAMYASIFVVSTLIFHPIAYGPIQFRPGEILTLFAFFDPIAIWGLVIGNIIVNFFGPIGMIDVIFGSLATVIMGLTLWKMKNLDLALFLCSVITGLIVGPYLGIFFKIPIHLSMLYVGVSQAISLWLVGRFIGLYLLKRPEIMKKLFGTYAEKKFNL